MKGPRIPLTLAASVLLLSTLPADAQNLLSNGQFDGGVDGWASDDPLPPDSAFSWDPSEGVPPGSALLESSFDGNADIVVSSACLPFQGEADYRIVADLLSDEGDCVLLLEAHVDSSDCSGQINPQIYFQAPDLGWSRIDQTVFVGAETQAMRVQLLLRRTPGSLAQCRYDNVALFGPPQPTLEIPALGPRGLGALAVLLLVVGLTMLRRG